MYQSIASVLAAVAKSVAAVPSSSTQVANTVANYKNGASAPVPTLPIELVDPLLALAIRLSAFSSTTNTDVGAGARTSYTTKQVLDVISQCHASSSLTLQAALVHGLPWFTVGHATGARGHRVIDEDARDSHSSPVRVSLLHALSRPHARGRSTSRLVPMSFHPSDLILPPSSSLTAQLAACDWWTCHLPLPTLTYLAPLILASPRAAPLTRHLLAAHAALGTEYSETDMDAALTLLAALASPSLTCWFRHAYAGLLKSLDTATCVLHAPDAGALTLAHELAAAPRVAKHAIMRACECGDVDALKYYASIGCAIDASPRAMDAASAAGHVGVLEWWVGASMDVKYSEDAVDMASRAGHVDVLAWWWARRGERAVEYTEAGVDGASAEGRVEVLRWWAEKPGVKYSEAAVHDAALNGHVDVLDWWASESRMPVKVDAPRLAEQLSRKLDASGVRVLEWWVAQRALPSLVDAVDVRILEACATREAIEYWMPKVGCGSSQWVRQWTWPKLTFAVPATNDARVVEWWARESGLAFAPSTDLVTHLAVLGDMESLAWWSRRGPLPALRGQDVFKVMHAGRVDSLSWIAAHGGEIVVQEYAVLLEAAKSLDPRVVDWVVKRYYRGRARMSTQWDGMVEAVDAYGMSSSGKGRGGVKGFVGMGGVRLVG